MKMNDEDQGLKKNIKHVEKCPYLKRKPQGFDIYDYKSIR